MYFAFSIQDVPDDSIIAPGWYPAKIVRSDIRDLRSGDGQRLILTYTIASGPYAGRKVDAGFNHAHPNPVAVEISQKELAKVLRACGLSQIQDTLELHDHPHHIYIGVETYKDREQNRISDWKPMAPAGVSSQSAVPPAFTGKVAPAASKVALAASQAFQAPPTVAPPAKPVPAPPASPFPSARPNQIAAPAAAAVAAVAEAVGNLDFNDDIPF